MGPILTAGQPMVLIARAADTTQSILAEASTIREGLIELVLRGEETHGPDEHALLMVHSGGSWHAPVRVLSWRSGATSLMLTGAWRPGERRAHPRFPLWSPSVVFSQVAPGWISALVIDISLGGAAIEVAAWPDRLGLDWYGERCPLECEVVSVERTDFGAVLHARFVALTDEQRRRLATIVDAAGEAAAAAERQLAVLSTHLRDG